MYFSIFLRASRPWVRPKLVEPFSVLKFVVFIIQLFNFGSGAVIVGPGAVYQIVLIKSGIAGFSIFIKSVVWPMSQTFVKMQFTPEQTIGIKTEPLPVAFAKAECASKFHDTIVILINVVTAVVTVGRQDQQGVQFF